MKRSRFDVLGRLEEKFGDYKDVPAHPGEEYRFNCPQCGDHGHHMYINVQELVGHCKRCTFSFHLVEIFGRAGLPKHVIKPKVRRVVKEVPTEDFIPLETAVSDFSEVARQYLKRRGIFSLQDIYLGIQGQWFGRVVFPVFERGKMVFATGRSIIGREPKYHNTEGEKSWHVYRLDVMASSPSIIICEGCIDALTVPGGIALFGKDISPVQVAKLKVALGPDKPVFIGLDGDARIDAEKMHRQLRAHFRRVRILNIPDGEDLNSLGRNTRLTSSDGSLASAIRAKLGG